MIYSTPIIEITEMDVNDIILTSGPISGGTGNDYETDIMSNNGGGSISGTTGGKITIGSTTTGGVSAGDIFGNR